MTGDIVNTHHALIIDLLEITILTMIAIITARIAMITVREIIIVVIAGDVIECLYKTQDCLDVGNINKADRLIQGFRDRTFRIYKLYLIGYNSFP
ncbi:MAG: hypothetical protein ACI909_003198 [Planctomycetota bacterium]|jgi:hypothetical protein